MSFLEQYKVVIYIGYTWIFMFANLTAGKSIGGVLSTLPTDVLISQCNTESQCCVCLQKVGTMCHLQGVPELSILQVSAVDGNPDNGDNTFTSSCSCNNESKNCRGFSMNLVLVSEHSWNETEILLGWDAIKLSVESALSWLMEVEPSPNNYTLVFILIDDQLIYISTEARPCSSLQDDTLIDIYTQNRSNFKTSENYPGLEQLILAFNETLVENAEAVVPDYMYWVIVILVLIFVLCWITYAQMAFWCIYHRYSTSKGIEVPSSECWTATYACMSTFIASMVFFVVLYFLVIMPLIEPESCPQVGIVAHSKFA